MRREPVLALDAQRRAIVRAAAHALRATRDVGDVAPLHRSLRHLELRKADLAQAVLLAAALTLVLWFGRYALAQGWHDLIAWWAARLDVPLALVEAGARLQWVLFAEGASLVPGPVTGVLTAAAVMGAFAATFWMPDRMVPLKVLVRTLCAIQASALVYFMGVPSQFPYTVGGHLEALLDTGYYLMLTMPALLALGHGVLRVPFAHKVLAGVGCIAFFALMLPHKALLHVLLLQHGSVLFMPVLYLCFGLVFDVMVFVALYSWLVSHVPMRAPG